MIKFSNNLIVFYLWFPFCTKLMPWWNSIANLIGFIMILKLTKQYLKLEAQLGFIKSNS